MTLIAGIASVVANAGLVHPKKRLEICRDPKDDMLLECCIAAKADFLVTGDQDLLSISGLPFAVGIVTSANYLATKNRKR
jgi:predicted nucleic acid-binding protein